MHSISNPTNPTRAAKVFITVTCIALCSALTYVGISAYQRHLVETRCEELLQDAMNKVDAVTEARALEFSQFIEARSAGAKPFSKELVSVAGSMAIIECKLPGAAEDCFQLYVLKQFGEHLFTPAVLQGALNNALAGGTQDIETIENQLALAVRQEILGNKLAFDQKPVLASEFKRGVETLRAATDADLAKSATGLVVTELVTHVGTKLLTRLLASTGMLTLGAANSWWTFGGSLALGVALNELWTHLTHPAETIENELRRELEKMASAGRTAIRTELGNAVSARKALWQAALKERLQ